MRHELETLERLLAQHGESGPAQMSRAALDGTDQKLRACLASNELWGGAGAAQKVIQSVARKVIHPKAVHSTLAPAPGPAGVPGRSSGRGGRLAPAARRPRLFDVEHVGELANEISVRIEQVDLTNTRDLDGPVVGRKPECQCWRLVTVTINFTR